MYVYKDQTSEKNSQANMKLNNLWLYIEKEIELKFLKQYCVLSKYAFVILYIYAIVTI